MNEIPAVDIGPLFGDDAVARGAADTRIAEAAFDIGFMVVTGHPSELSVGPAERAVMLELFDLPSGRDDLLYEATPLPDPAELPEGWVETARDYFLGMEDIGHRILASLSRSLGVEENIFRDAFDDGISTLRLLHYPKRPDDEPEVEDVPERFVVHDGKKLEQVARSHVDSGLLTVLAQCGVGGLQARNAQGGWIAVPVIDDGFAINFGGLLERWTGGRIKATAHRVLAQGENRYSVPFFFEPRPSARIAPLPIPGIRPFAPFLYGDHLWATTTKFPENFGLADLRPARAAYTDPMAG